MSLGKYRVIDLTILAVIMFALEALCWFGFSRFDTTFSVSVCTIVALIVVLRWNAFGLIHAVIGGIATVFLANFFNQETLAVQDLVIYGVGNAFVALELIYVKLIGKQKIYSGGWYLILYATIGFLSVCVGRTLVGLFFGKTFTNYFVQQIIAEALNYVFAVVILFITNKQEGVLRDQKEYFLEVRVGGKDEK